MADISKIKLPNNTTYDINATTVNGHTVNKDVPSNAVFTDTNTHRPIKVNGRTILGDNTTPFNLVSGDNVRMTNSGGSVTFSADQIDDSYTYDQYQALPSTTKMQDKIFMVKDAPNPPAIPIVDEYAREQVADVKSDLTEMQYNEVGTYVTLTRDVEYTTPSDGYFVIAFNQSDVSGNHYVYGYINNNRLLSINAPKSVATFGYEVNCIYVRKGSKIKINGSSVSVGYFYPLTTS